MKYGFILLAVIFVSGCASHNSGHQSAKPSPQSMPQAVTLDETNFTEAMYRRALNDGSTSPLYVLILLNEDKGNTNRWICIPAPFLLGAIHMEYHLEYDQTGEQQALDMAIKQYGMAFSFSDPKAFKNVQPRYSPEMLAEVRRSLPPISNSQRDVSALTGIYSNKKDYMAYRDALAHVLLERGFQAGIADITGGLYVAQ